MKLMNRWRKFLAPCIAAMFLAIGPVGCDNDSDLGEDIEEAADDLGRDIEDAVD